MRHALAIVLVVAACGGGDDQPSRPDARVHEAPVPDAMPFCPDPGNDLDSDGLCDDEDGDEDGDGMPDWYERGDGARPIDSDGDGTPDYRDFDSDGDGVKDEYEGSYDGDFDAVPAFRDQDADGDGIIDSIEGPAGQEPPNDFDDDGAYDFVDLDSDNDGLDDSLEDLNGNGILDPGESDPHDDDTDDDGFPDVVEQAFESDPQDPADGPPSDGVWVVILPGAGLYTATVTFTTDGTIDPASLTFVVTDDPHEFVETWTPLPSTATSIDYDVTFQNTTWPHMTNTQVFAIRLALVDSAGTEISTASVGVLILGTF